MTDLLTTEITGEPVTVSLRGSAHAIAYPMHNILLFKKLTGLSLFAAATWSKIDFEEDSESWTACLWAGLHVRQADGTWKAPFTLDQLNDPRVIGLQNAVSVHNAMFRALTNWMPRKKTEDAEASGNDQADAETEKKRPQAIETTSPGSGFAPNADSTLLGQNS